MLVLTRKDGERLRIGDNVVVVLVRTWFGRARLGIEAPKDVRIVREEIGDLPPAPPVSPQQPTESQEIQQ